MNSFFKKYRARRRSYSLTETPLRSQQLTRTKKVLRRTGPSRRMKLFDLILDRGDRLEIIGYRQGVFLLHVLVAVRRALNHFVH